MFDEKVKSKDFTREQLKKINERYLNYVTDKRNEKKRKGPNV